MIDIEPIANSFFLVVIPLAAVVLGLTVLRQSPGRLLTFGYGIEGPLMLIVAIRFFAVREATPMMTLLFVIAALGLAAFLWQVLDRRIGERKLWEITADETSGIPHVRFGKAVVYPVDLLRDWLAERARREGGDQ